MALLSYPLLAACAQLVRPDLLAIAPTDSELDRQLAEAAYTSRIGFQKLRTQIIRIGQCHRLRFAEFADSNMLLIPPMRYSYYGSALRCVRERAVTGDYELTHNL